MKLTTYFIPKLIVNSFFLLYGLLSLLLFVSCSKLKKDDNNIKQELIVQNSLNREYSVEMGFSNNVSSLNNETEPNRFIYKSSFKNGVITSTLRVTNADSVIYATNYQIDTTISNYRLLQHNTIKGIAQTLNFPIDSSGYSILSSQLRNFLETILNSDTIYRVDVQALFFHYAILNTKLRGINSNQYECNPHPGYIIGRLFFWCQEDYIVPKSVIMDVFAQHPELLNDTSTNNLYNYVSGSINQNFSYDKIYAFQATKVNYLQTLENIINQNSPESCASWCILGCGSSWGCCGNYAGCCFYWNMGCYIHDRMCVTCRPKWYCFSGCVPDR